MENLTKVDSSMVYAIGYDSNTKDLDVVFNTGNIWIYRDVPQNVYKELLNSRSVGTFMLNNIIDYYKEYKTN
ncbi:KTSC domain-containing protein [Sulfurovum sp. bin170]|uniref:KTSC domain-containing protein n=1 Tax=Sulfurovum sp. bin170 TaxID=2695268 RepID=UPI001CB6B9B2|nr:KTSC domain-containing protein [Sulfurovum sp. bin170]